MNEVFIVKQGPGNFIVSVNPNRIIAELASRVIMSIWDNETQALRACLLANQAFELADQCKPRNRLLRLA